MKEPKDRYHLVYISVKISSEGGRGFTEEDLDKMCKKLEKTAQGRSKQRNVSAVIA